MLGTVEEMTYQVKKGLGVTRHDNETTFRVWAPFAKGVAVRGSIVAEATPLNKEDDGYWSISLKDVEPGQSYKYRIETAEGVIVERNDPRARQLTSSEGGESVVVDEDFDWQDVTFEPISADKQIIYELHVGTFNRPDASTVGTFSTAIDKLDYLKDLGVNMVELMPITSMAFSYGWGYAPNHLYSVEANYGGRHGLLEFVREAHRRGIGVILDVVYNHFFTDTDLWQFDGWSENEHGGIYFYNDPRGETPWGARPDFGRPEVRQFILDNVAMWFEDYKLDGLRVDSTIYMRNTEGKNDDPAHDIPEAWSLLAEINDVAHKINPHAMMIAEDCAGNAYLTKPKKDAGCAFDAQWELGFPHVLREALGLKPDVDRSLKGIDYEITKDYNGNAFEKVIFSDSHDTAANGSVRLNEAASPGDADSTFAREKQLLANAVTLTSPGIPMLLQGQEFVQEGSFNDWKELEWDKAETYKGIVQAHRHLIDLRINTYGHTQGLLGQHTEIFHQDDTNLVIAYRRWDKGGPEDETLTIVNFGDSNFDDYELHLPSEGTWTVRFNSTWKGYSKDFKEVKLDTVTTGNARSATIPIAPYQVLLLSQDK
jgi:1,4-alpha-glucan branching enzyme